MDVNVEDMNGFKTCEPLKSDFATSFIFVTVLTSQDQVQNKIVGRASVPATTSSRAVDPLELQASIEMGIRRSERRVGVEPGAKTAASANATADVSLSKELGGAG